MSIRRVLETMRSSGGVVSLKELQVRDAHADRDVARLLKQGYIERVDRGLYRLTALGQAGA